MKSVDDFPQDEQLPNKPPPGVSPHWYTCIRQEPHWVLRYGAAVVLAGAALLLTGLFARIDPTAEFRSLNIAAAIVAALYGGLWSALLAALICAMGVDFFFTYPYYNAFDSVGSVARVIVYLSVVGLVSSLISALRAACRVINKFRLDAERVSRARQGVLAIVSHDLKNPITAQMSNTRLLEKALIQRGITFPELLKPLYLMRASAEQMNRMIEDLQDAVRIDVGHFKLNIRERDPNGLIEEAIEVACPLALEKGLTLERQVVAGLPMVSCDRIEQVISNLLGNAIKFTPKGGRILLRVEPEGDFVKFSVRDTGPGVAESDIPHLFTRFWQGKSGQDSKKGSGLGLFIAKGIVESNGGSIGVDSKAGEGATFYFTVPTLEARRRISDRAS